MFWGVWCVLGCVWNWGQTCFLYVRIFTHGMMGLPSTSIVPFPVSLLSPFSYLLPSYLHLRTCTLWWGAPSPSTLTRPPIRKREQTKDRHQPFSRVLWAWWWYLLIYSCVVTHSGWQVWHTLNKTRAHTHRHIRSSNGDIRLCVCANPIRLPISLLRLDPYFSGATYCLLLVHRSRCMVVQLGTSCAFGVNVNVLCLCVLLPLSALSILSHIYSLRLPHWRSFSTMVVMVSTVLPPLLSLLQLLLTLLIVRERGCALPTQS